MKNKTLKKVSEKSLCGFIEKRKSGKKGGMETVIYEKRMFQEKVLKVLLERKAMTK